MRRLPTTWSVQRDDGAPPPEGALVVAWSTVRGTYPSLSAAILDGGLRALGLDAFPDGPLVVRLPRFPTLDEAWALYVLGRLASGEPIHPAWSSVVRYCTDVRQGFSPERVAPDRAIQSVYLAIVQKCLVGAATPFSDFVGEALALCDAVAEKVQAGARLLDDDLVSERPELARYLAVLDEDKHSYEADRRRGQAFLATLPAEHDAHGVAQEVSLLFLDRPTAAQFKLWARTDPTAPYGRGYDLLLVWPADGAVVLSANPAKPHRVGWLAGALTTLERTKRASDEGSAWYDGRDHGETLVAAPLPGGTSLAPQAVLEHLRRILSLRPIPKTEPEARTFRLSSRWKVAATVGLAAAALAFVQVRSNVSDSVRRADPGRPLPDDEVRRLVTRHQRKGDGELERYALLAGVCRYPDEMRLYSPCQDARRLRDLLVDHYGYHPDHVVVMVDDRPDSPAHRPTASNLRLAIERFADLRRRDDTSFLFFYSGHGTYERGARRRYGLLQPAGFFDSTDLSEDDRGWDMQAVRVAIQKHIRSPHVMIVLDSCKSGWATGDTDSPSQAPPTEVLSNWREPTEVVLTAAGRSQSAWSDDPAEPQWNGLSAMTFAFVEGLEPDASGHPPADVNRDGVVTDQEVATYVQHEVPELVRAAHDGERQDPQFERFEEGQAMRGQFLFVPAPAVQ